MTASGPRPVPVRATMMTARQIVTDYQGLDTDRIGWASHVTWESDEDLFERKLWEAERRSPEGQELPWISVDDGHGIPRSVLDGVTLADDIKARGVRRPIGLREDPSKLGRLGRPEIVSGHHRLAVMLAYYPDVPIRVAYYASAEAAYYVEHRVNLSAVSSQVGPELQRATESAMGVGVVEAARRAVRVATTAMRVRNRLPGRQP